MDNRDMMEYGYYQNIPSMMYGNFGYEGPPGSLINGMPYGVQGMNSMPNNMPIYNNANNPIYEINNRLNNLENRIKVLENKLNTSSNLTQDDNSMYML